MGFFVKTDPGAAISPLKLKAAVQRLQVDIIRLWQWDFYLHWMSICSKMTSWAGGGPHESNTRNKSQHVQIREKSEQGKTTGENNL